jgi:hypothetical protein
MKKFLIALSLSTISLGGLSQTCEEREDKLLGALGALSAGYMYNTYAAIGAICDGFIADTYSQDAADEMLDNQKKLSDNLAKQLTDLIEKNVWLEKNDQDFMRASLLIIKGLKNQAQYFQDYMKNKSDQRKDKFEDQRKENWKQISKLMGLDK